MRSENLPRSACAHRSFPSGLFGAQWCPAVRGRGRTLRTWDSLGTLSPNSGCWGAEIHSRGDSRGVGLGREGCHRREDTEDISGRQVRERWAVSGTLVGLFLRDLSTGGEGAGCVVKGKHRLTCPWPWTSSDALSLPETLSGGCRISL